MVGSSSVVEANSKVNVISSLFPSDVLGWRSNIDNGIPNSAPDVALAMPFLVNGSTLSTTENQFSMSVLLYSKYESEIITIHNPSGLIMQQIEIYDSNTRLIKKLECQATSDFEVNVNEFGSGLYIMKLITKEGVILKSFLKS